VFGCVESDDESSASSSGGGGGSGKLYPGEVAGDLSVSSFSSGDYSQDIVSTTGAATGRVTVSSFASAAAKAVAATMLPPVAVAVPAEEASVHEIDASPMRVLLVDDTASVRRIATLILQREGYCVTSVDNGTDALALMRGQRGEFDVVLMDLQMPVLDGIETVRQFRAQERRTLQPGEQPQTIFAVTASSDSSIPEEVRAVGFDGFIEKPLKVPHLKALLATVHKKAAAEAENGVQSASDKSALTMEEPSAKKGEVRTAAALE
jgi:CheY-like chemotaxis protein